MSAPIGNTCPDIDEVLDGIKTASDHAWEGFKSLEGLNRVMEELRTANSTLREYGEKQEERADRLEQELDELRSEYEAFKTREELSA